MAMLVSGRVWDFVCLFVCLFVCFFFGIPPGGMEKNHPMEKCRFVQKEPVNSGEMYQEKAWDFRRNAAVRYDERSWMVSQRERFGATPQGSN